MSPFAWSLLLIVAVTIWASRLQRRLWELERRYEQQTHELYDVMEQRDAYRVAIADHVRAARVAALEEAATFCEREADSALVNMPTSPDTISGANALKHGARRLRDLAAKGGARG